MAETKITAEPGVPQIVVTRHFNFPRELVFQACTDPELVKQWLGPRRLETRFDCCEVRDGGRYRFVQWGEDGYEHAFRGVYHGTPTPESTVRTFEYEGAPGHVMLETTTLEEADGGTLMTGNSVFQTVADRDMMVAAGMDEGVYDSMARLEELLARLAPVS